jgi:hypothetical protein
MTNPTDLSPYRDVPADETEEPRVAGTLDRLDNLTDVKLIVGYVPATEEAFKLAEAARAATGQQP